MSDDLHELTKAVKDNKINIKHTIKADQSSLPSLPTGKIVTALGLGGLAGGAGLGAGLEFSRRVFSGGSDQNPERSLKWEAPSSPRPSFGVDQFNRSL